MQFIQPFRNTDKVMLEPVCHQKRLAVGGFDDVLQCVQLAVVDLNDLAVVIINSAVCHLGQLAGEGRSVCGGNLGITQRQHQLLLQVGVFLFFIIG